MHITFNRHFLSKPSRICMFFAQHFWSYRFCAMIRFAPKSSKLDQNFSLSDVPKIPGIHEFFLDKHCATVVDDLVEVTFPAGWEDAHAMKSAGPCLAQISLSRFMFSALSFINSDTISLHPLFTFNSLKCFCGKCDSHLAA